MSIFQLTFIVLVISSLSFFLELLISVSLVITYWLFKLKVWLKLFYFFLLKIIILMSILLNLIHFIAVILICMSLKILILDRYLSFLVEACFFLLILKTILLKISVLLVIVWANCLLLVIFSIIIVIFNKLTIRFIFPVLIWDKFLVNFRLLVLLKFFVLIIINRIWRGVFS